MVPAVIALSFDDQIDQPGEGSGMAGAMVRLLIDSNPGPSVALCEPVGCETSPRSFT